MSRSRLISIFGVVALVFGITAVQSPMALAAGGPYLVDNTNPSCSDSYTLGTPFCTISAAAKQAAAGDQVLVNPGTYDEQVGITASGSPGSPITFTASAPGVVVSGSTDYSDPTGWTAPAAGAMAWSRPVAVEAAPSRVLSDGAPLTKAPSILAMTPGSFYYDSTFGVRLLYVQAVDPAGPNPAIGHTLVGYRTNGFSLSAVSDVTVDGFTTSGQYNAGVNIQNSTGGVTISGVTAQSSSSYGILAQGSTAVTVTGATALNNGSIGILFRTTTASTIVGSSAHDNGLHGISLQSSPNNLVADNTSYKNVNPVGVHLATGIDLTGSTGVTVERNTTYGNSDSGIQVYTGSNNAIVRRNISYDNGDHGLDCLNSPGESVVGNTVLGNFTVGINLEGAAPAGCSGSVVANNISSDNAVVTPSSTGTPKGDIRLDLASSPGSTVDRNVVYMTGGGALYNWNGTSYTTVPAFRAASAQGLNDIGADPRFMSTAARDLGLRSSSPAIDNADLTMRAADPIDHDGSAPVDHPFIANTGVGTPPFADRGALEYHGPAAVLFVTPASGPAPLTVTADASSSVGLGGAIASYTFDCGNGTVTVQQSSITTCSYLAAGVFTVTVTVRDVNGISGQATATVTATNQAPVAALTATPSTDYAPATVTLDATGSRDPEGGPLSYSLTCGNSTPAVSTPTATCVYPAAGNFSATATVTDNQGATSSVSKSVTIKADVAPTVKLASIKGTAKVNESLLVDASRSTDPDKTPIATYLIDCGNGIQFGPGSASSATCQYTQSGTYTIQVTVTDTIGKIGSASEVVKVK